jgi:predicted Rossmann fold flavoprotein
LKIAIIGAGAAGIIASIYTKKLNSNIKIDLFEINTTIGKKILASGNGRCNISNKIVLQDNFMGKDNSFVNYCLNQFDYKDFEKFCNSIGLLLDIKDNNKVYPLSNEAKSVVSLLQSKLNSLNVNIIYEKRVIDIQKIDNKFTLNSFDGCKYKDYDKVLISSGLSAAPQLNSTNDGLKIAKKFGHTIHEEYPSLVGLQLDTLYHHKLSGMKKEVEVTLYINNKKDISVKGDVLFTKYGFSGFGILDISQKSSYYLSLKNDIKISINFFPDLSKDSLINSISNIMKSLPNENLSIVLGGLISNKLSPILLDICNLDNSIKCYNINSRHIRSITNQLLNWRVKVINTQGFKHAEVSGGGISTNDIDDKTMQSKLIKGLFFSGEILDITGQRGGYNLHFAWASGYLASKFLSK